MKYFMAVALFFTVAGIVYCDGTMTEYSVAADVITYSVLTMIWLALLWHLWNGRNWARITVMIWCALAVVSIFMIGEYSPIQKFVTITDTVFSVIWFWWLRTPAAVAFTKGKAD